MAATVILAVPLAKFAVGVKTAVRVIPVPLMALRVAPETNRSPVVPFHVKLEPGSSVNVKVMAAVSLIFKVVTSEEMVTDGERVSMLMEGEVPAEPVLPAAS